MKIVCMLLFTLSTIFTGTTEESTLNQETKTIIAEFVEAKDGGYQFKSDNKLMVFYINSRELAKTVSETINFSDSSTKGKFFKIEYTEDNAKNEQGDDYIYRAITAIELALS